MLESCWSPLHSRISLKKDGTQGSEPKFRNLSQHCKQHLHNFTLTDHCQHSDHLVLLMAETIPWYVCPESLASQIPKYMNVSLTCMWAKSFQACLTLCDPLNCSPPGSSVHGILQARILEWVVMPSSRRASQPRDQIHVSYISCIGRWVLSH